VTDPHVITAEAEEITITEGVVVLQHLSQQRPVPAASTPGPHPRVSASPPVKGKGSKARR
jgi:hypothetical protein